MTATTTPARITTHIHKLCRRLGLGWKPQFVPVLERNDSGFRDCFNDVQRHIAENGGSIVYGWLLWEWPGILVEAEFHAVWQSPEGELLDVSEKPCGETTVLFIKDPTRVFSGRRVDNVRLAVGKDPRISELISGHEHFNHLLQQRHGDEVGEIHLDEELSLLAQALAVLANQLNAEAEQTSTQSFPSRGLR